MFFFFLLASALFVCCSSQERHCPALQRKQKSKMLLHAVTHLITSSSSFKFPIPRYDVESTTVISEAVLLGRIHTRKLFGSLSLVWTKVQCAFYWFGAVPFLVAVFVAVPGSTANPHVCKDPSRTGPNRLEWSGAAKYGEEKKKNSSCSSQFVPLRAEI